MKLSESLAQFASSNPSAFDNPFQEENTQHRTASEFLEREEAYLKEKRKSKSSHRGKENDDLQRLIEKAHSTSIGSSIDDMVEDFEGYLEDYLMDDADDEFRRNLVKYGRKYARNTRDTGEGSEIQKAYAEQEAELDQLIKDIDMDKENINKDIQKMRSYRSVNFKTLSELVETRTSLHNTHLGAIKEKNSVVKNKFELQMKANKEKDESEGDSTVANRMIQNLFGMGRDALISDYSDVSGAAEAGMESAAVPFDEEDFIDKRFGEDEFESDGDKFLKYEGVFKEYVLEYDDDGPVQIVAEDIDGNVIPDYPLPDINNLDFTISESTNSATDNLSQQYILRKV